MKKLACFSQAIYLLTIYTCVRLVCNVRCPHWSGPSVGIWDVGLYGDTCYVIARKSTSSWSDANDVCERNGWRLLHIKTPEKNAFYTILLESLYRSRDFGVCSWMGLTDKKKEAHWVWTDGTTATFNLVVTDPFGFLLHWVQDCVMMCKNAIGKGYQWKADICEGASIDAELICESDVLPDEPTTAAVPYAERRRRRKQKHFIVHNIVELLGYCLLSAPIKVIKVMDVTNCARACTSEKSVQCVLVNFHKRSRACALYSGLDVLNGPREHRRDWEVWKVR